MTRFIIGYGIACLTVSLLTVLHGILAARSRD